MERMISGDGTYRLIIVYNQLLEEQARFIDRLLDRLKYAEEQDQD